MIALKLVFQSLAGAGSVLACVGGGYYVMKDGNEEDFYLVSATKEASDSPSTELWTSPTLISKPSGGKASTIFASSSPTTETKTQKNYKCLSGETNNTEVDNSCYLYSLTPTATNTAIKISEIQAFIKDTNATSTVVAKTETKATITANKFFLLKVSEQIHTTWTFDGTKTIQLVEKTATTAEASKTYATFKVHAKISSSEVKGKTPFAIVKYLKAEPSTISIAANETVTCKLVNTETATPEGCFVTEITEPIPPADLEKIVFASITNPATQQAISIAKDKYYLVQFQTPKIHSLTELGAEEIIVVSPTSVGTAASTTPTELKIQTPAFILPTSGSITEAIIIK